jgi:hypothetical protein
MRMFQMMMVLIMMNIFLQVGNLKALMKMKDFPPSGDFKG